MSLLKIFTFNPFQENSYIISNEKNECIIFDPGCCDDREQREISDYISQQNLTPIRLINTHCHIDHVLGNLYISQKYKLKLEAHRFEVPVLESGERVSQMYGIPYITSPEISTFLEEGDKIVFGDVELELLLVPGHSPGSLCFVNKKDKYIIAGDVLFNGSIGRTDLPLGDHDTLISSIKQKLFVLDGDYKVYPGHGPYTTIEKEQKTNPFLT